MSETLNLFPARVAIGTYTDAAGNSQAVLASPEFHRALTALFERVGGPNGMDIRSFEILAAFAPAPIAQESAEVDLQDVFSPSPAVAASPDFGQPADMAARVAELEKRLAEAELKLEAAASMVAQVGEMTKRINDVAQSLEITPQPQETAELAKTVMALQIEAAFAPPTTDWEHPGQIGAKTANTGKFTTINGMTITTSTGTFTLTNGKTLTVTNTITLTGTDSQTYTFPTTSATMARTDAGQTFTGDERFDGNIGIRKDSEAAVSLVIKGQGTTNATRSLALLDSALNDCFNVYDDKTARVFGDFMVPGGAVFLKTAAALTDGAGAGAGTITNAPAAGNPTKWIGINDNGTTRYIPSW